MNGPGLAGLVLLFLVIGLLVWFKVPCDTLQTFMTVGDLPGRCL